MARMPLKFRSTGVAFSSEETSKDCTAWSGGWTIGYIYYRAPEDDRDEPLTWIWSMHGVPGKPPGMRGHGVSPTLEGAQAKLEESWQAWLRWRTSRSESQPGEWDEARIPPACLRPRRKRGCVSSHSLRPQK